MKRFLLFALSISVYFNTSGQPPKNLSSSDIQLSLRKLNHVGSVLYIAAHPDDENTRLLSYLANEKCLRTGYLSITRGDGGQNLIGKEQGELLGLIRTQELLAARRVDGAEQFFTRANDFGYSKNPEETFSFWGHDSILADVVWVIRNFQPDMIITRFATDGSGGHGHHTASGVLAEEAFTAAADPTRFPEQLNYVKPWQAKQLFLNSGARFSNPNADMSSLIPLDVGHYNELLGKSYGEISAESRSMHKSQGFGSARNRGSYIEYFKPLKGDTTVKNIFEGIDFSWHRIEGGEVIEKLIRELSSSFNPQNPSASVKKLIRLYNSLDKIKDVTLRERKKKETLDLILACSGIYVDALANTYSSATGDTLRITTYALNRSDLSVTVKSISIENAFDSSFTKVLANNQLFSFEKQISIKSDAAITNPYWLSMPHTNGLFTVRDQTLIGKPQNEASLKATITLTIEGQDFSVTRPVQYKWVEPSDGERYRPFVVQPDVMMNFINETVVFPSKDEKKISLRIKAGRDSAQGVVKLKLPASWKVQPAELSFLLKKKGDEQDIVFTVTPPVASAEALAFAEATIGGKIYSKSLIEIKHDHIPVQTYFAESKCRVVKLELKRTLNNIGYIEGAGDDISQCLQQLGYSVILINEKTLAENNLDRFDAIITGIRAFNTNDRLILHKQKLMDYVAQGGNLVIQYNTNSNFGPLKSDLGPYPFKISRERVTREEAPVTFALPDHTLLNTPNKITDKDFNGWIQERGIYFANGWDSAYRAPLSMSDPGEKDLKGSTLTAQFGKGNFIYTGLAFFRQLPAGVPGAYRLFVNMIEMGR